MARRDGIPKKSVSAVGRGRPGRISWARLLKRFFDIDMLARNTEPGGGAGRRVGTSPLGIGTNPLGIGVNPEPEAVEEPCATEHLEDPLLHRRIDADACLAHGDLDATRLGSAGIATSTRPPEGV